MDRLAQTCEDIARHANRSRKIRILTGYLQTLDETDLAIASQLLSAGPVSHRSANGTLFALEERRPLRIGYAVMREALRLATGWDKQTLSVCYEQVGDAGETVGLLAGRISSGLPLTLRAAEALYEELFHAGTAARRLELLVEIFRKYRPLTLKYFIKMMTRRLRMGLLPDVGALLADDKPYATLDVVITAAEQNSFTFAVRAAGGFANVGKAHAEFTGDEMRELGKRLRAASIEKFGRVLLVKPECVLEVAFDGLRRSKRGKSGYALRSPRILRWRQDKKPEECDDLERVAALYQASLV